MSVALNISYTKSNLTKGTKAVPNISETASDSDIYNFAQGLIGLSYDTFTGVKKIVTTEISAPTQNGGD